MESRRSPPCPLFTMRHRKEKLLICVDIFCLLKFFFAYSCKLISGTPQKLFITTPVAIFQFHFTIAPFLCVWRERGEEEERCPFPPSPPPVSTQMLYS